MQVKHEEKAKLASQLQEYFLTCIVLVPPALKQEEDDNLSDACPATSAWPATVVSQ